MYGCVFPSCLMLETSLIVAGSLTEGVHKAVTGSESHTHI